MISISSDVLGGTFDPRLHFMVRKGRREFTFEDLRNDCVSLLISQELRGDFENAPETKINTCYLKGGAYCSCKES
jgi:hypothetical protein